MNVYAFTVDNHLEAGIPRIIIGIGRTAEAAAIDAIEHAMVFVTTIATEKENSETIVVFVDRVDRAEIRLTSAFYRPLTL